MPKERFKSYEILVQLNISLMLGAKSYEILLEDQIQFTPILQGLKTYLIQKKQIVQ